MVIAIGAFKAVGILIAPDLIRHTRFVCFTVQCLKCDHYTFVLIHLAEDMLLSTHTPDTVPRIKGQDMLLRFIQLLSAKCLKSQLL